MQTVDTGHIVIDPAVLGGEPHIAGRRIAVSHIAVWIVYQGESPEAVAGEFALTLGEVYAALAYYYDHQSEIDNSIAETAQRADEMARRYPHGWSREKDLST
ncbi:MAG TPA: DUF433 domain-containing protein [Ktedonobacterales bacterium]|jgi:uncharacterized protein (DUF433 family)|nr:DUF433 domain-containing protein [Ktedonobacterales bacterium]